MKYLNTLFIIFFIQIAHLHNECNQDILEFYDLQGVQNPIAYHKIVDELSYDFCPETKLSCCTSDDFRKTRDLW